MANDQEKQLAAHASLQFVRAGDIVGLGSGSTVAYAVRFLGERVRAGLKVRGVATSIQTQSLAVSLEIPLITLDEVREIDVTIDGTDEFDPELRLIKGGGGALLREKIVASASREEIIIADSTKQVSVLGNCPLPVEVIRFAQAVVSKKISALGATVQLRKDRAGEPFVTDEGNHILDCHFAVGRAQAHFHALALELRLGQLLEKWPNGARVAGARNQPDDVARGPLVGA